jgi:hypothetical protein
MVPQHQFHRTRGEIYLLCQVLPVEFFDVMPQQGQRDDEWNKTVMVLAD